MAKGRKRIVWIALAMDVTTRLWLAGAVSQHLNKAKIILLLISPNFIESDYCYGIEMQHDIERHEREEAHVIPIILRPTDWDNTPFSKLQALPDCKMRLETQQGSGLK